MYKNEVPAEYIARQAARESRSYIAREQDGWQPLWQADQPGAGENYEDGEDIQFGRGNGRPVIRDGHAIRPPQFPRTN